MRPEVSRHADGVKTDAVSLMNLAGELEHHLGCAIARGSITKEEDGVDVAFGENLLLSVSQSLDHGECLHPHSVP